MSAKRLEPTIVHTDHTAMFAYDIHGLGHSVIVGHPADAERAKHKRHRQDCQTDGQVSVHQTRPRELSESTAKAGGLLLH